MLRTKNSKNKKALSAYSRLLNDPFGPFSACGNPLFAGVSTIDGKFGHTELYTDHFVVENLPSSTNNHSMSNYKDVVNGISYTGNHQYGLTLSCGLVTEELELKCSKKSIEVGKTTKISADINRKSLQHLEVVWSSDSPNIASVDEDGNIKGIKKERLL